MIVASWNVNSLSVRLEHVVNWLRGYQPDVLCLQETKMIDEKFPTDRFSELGYHCVFSGEKAYNGVAVISKTKAEFMQKGFKVAHEFTAKRLLEVKIGEVYVVNVYIPNGSEIGSEKFVHKLAWIETLRDYLDSCHNIDEKLVLCGDFNVAPEPIDVWDPQQMEGQILFSKQERDAIESIRCWGLIDAFRIHNHDPGNFSWWDYRMNAFKRKIGLRIDHIWVTRPLAEKCVRAWIDTEPRKLERPSDHAPVAAEFSV